MKSLIQVWLSYRPLQGQDKGNTLTFWPSLTRPAPLVPRYRHPH